MEILDLAIEWALHVDGVTPSKGGRYLIVEKTKAAVAGIAPLRPFGSSSNSWVAALGAYAGTEQLRHDLVHRQASVLSDGTLTPSAQVAGSKVKPLSAEQQESFCRVAQRLARILIDQELRPRVEADMLWHLERLTDHHGRTITGAVAVPMRPFRVAVNTFDDQGRPTIDVPAIRTQVQRANPGPFYDLHVHMPDGATFEADLELLPNDVVPIDPVDPGRPFRRI